MLDQNPPGDSTANGSTMTARTAPPTRGAQGRPRRTDQTIARGTSTTGQSFAATAAPTNAHPALCLS